MKDKILVQVDSISKIEKLQKLGITNFLLPLMDYSVGYNTFTLEEIENLTGNIYLLVNRILTDEDIDKFLSYVLPSNIKGLFIEDTGLYYALKTTKLELINFQNHLNNNYKTINFWLKYFCSIVTSTDITLEEIKDILSQSNKPLVIYSFGYPLVMYSRRSLVTNYFKHFNMAIQDNLEISLPNNKFFLRENNFGTGVFIKELLDIRPYLKELDDNKIKFYLFNGSYVDDEVLLDVLNGRKIENTSSGFLYKSTVYRIGDLK